jgi:hypothetical protein
MSRSWFIGFTLAMTAQIAVRADAPPSRYVVDADTVTDTKTTLVWQRMPGTHAVTFAAAQSYCQSLTLAGGGWRLPAMKELATLVDPTRYDPAIDSNVFPGDASDFYWSSTAVQVITGLRVYGVGFTDGAVNAETSDASHSARCVR